MALRTVGVKLTADITGFVGRMREASETTKKFSTDIKKAADSGKLDGLADKAAIMGTGLVAGFGYAVKAAADFDKQMSAVSAGTNATASEMKQLRAAALQAGKDTQYSATQAAEGITELGKAGVSTQAILSGGLKGALNLAAAGQISVAEAAETAASAMTQFKLSGNEVPHVADLLSAAAGKAQGSVHDMGQALNQAGLVASQTGLSIEETTGGLAAFANAGLIGSDAGTSFKQMLLMLQAPSGKTKDLMDELGISAYDANGKFVGLANLAGILKDKLKDLTPEARAAAMAQIFGADATRAASVMYEQGATGVQKWIDKVNDTGYANEQAAKLTDNLAGDIERLKGSLETMAIEAGSGANGGLRILVKALNAIVDGLAALPPGFSAVMTVMAGLGGVLLVAGAAWVKFRRTLTETAGQLREMGPAGEKAAAGLEKGSKMASKAALAYAGLSAISLGIKALTDRSFDVDRLAGSIEDLGRSGEVSGQLQELFGENMKDMGRVAWYAEQGSHGFGKFVNSVQSAIPVFGDLSDAVSEGVLGTSFNDAAAKFQAYDQALTQAMEKTGDAKIASQLWNQALEQSGLSTDQLAKQLPSAYAQVGNMNEKAMAAEDSLHQLSMTTVVAKETTEKYTTAAQAAAGALRGERAAHIALSDALKAESDPVFNLLEAQKRMTVASKASSQAIKEHGKNSQEAKDANLELAKSAINLEGAVGSVSDEFDGSMSPSLRQVMVAAGLSKAQIKQLEGQFGTAKKAADDFDGNYNAAAAAPGADKAKTQIHAAYLEAKSFKGDWQAWIKTKDAKKAQDAIKTAWDYVKGYDGNWTANIQTKGYAGVANDLRHLLAAQKALKEGTSVNEANRELGHFMAGGGAVYGPGSDTSDSIPARLSNNEYVIKASSVRKFGVNRLNYINNTGQLPANDRDAELTPGFASGGVVMPFPTTASKTKIPADEWSNAASFGGVGNGGAAGAGWKWMVAAVHKAFPGMGVYSTFRKNAITLSGNRSYHSVGRAVDFAPSKPLAEWINANYFARTKELITPWNSLNIHNGSRHTYTGAIFRQHNFAGGNAHDHWAMAHGGVIPEPVFGVGRSGRTYSFGEMGPERVIPHYATGGLVNVAPSAPTGSTGPTATRLDYVTSIIAARNAIASLTESMKENGKTFSLNTTKGRNNISALTQMIGAAQDLAKAKYNETGSIKQANKVYADYIKALDTTFKRMGMNAAQRKALIKAYSEQPKYDVQPGTSTAPSNSSSLVKATTDKMAVEDQLLSAKKAFAWTKPSFNLAAETGRAELTQLFGFLSAAQQGAQSMFEFTGSSSKATAFYNGYIAQLRAVLVKSGMTGAQADSILKQYGRITLTPATSNRWGGLYEHAAMGKLKDAQLANGGPTQYAWAEPSTGGELFAPKYGNLAKTRNQVQWAVQNWWGGDVSWGSRRSNGPMVVSQPISITLGSEVIERTIELKIDTAVGQILNASIYQSA